MQNIIHYLPFKSAQTLHNINKQNSQTCTIGNNEVLM